TYCQSILLKATHRLSAPALRAALAGLLEHHDALSLRFRSRNGRMIQSYETSHSPVPFAEVELGALCARPAPEVIGGLARSVVDSIRLDRGPIVSLVLFTGRPEGVVAQTVSLRRSNTDLSESQVPQPVTLRGDQWILLVIHHLVVDGVSWRILLEDL